MGKDKIVEEYLDMPDVDPMICKTKFKGAIDEHGMCRVRIETNPDEPDITIMRRLDYIPRGGTRSEERPPAP